MPEIEDTIQKAMGATYCSICDAKLDIPHNATAHYNSRRHRQKAQLYLEQILLEKKQKSASKNFAEAVKTNWRDNFRCLICNVFNLTEAEAAAHNNIDEHKKKEDAYCKTCDILTKSKEQLWSHMKTSNHNKKLEELGLPIINVQYSAFDLTLPPDLKNLMLSDNCQVCNKKLPTIKHALDHYGSLGHNSSVRHWFKERRKVKKQTSNNIKEDDSAFLLANSKTSPNNPKINNKDAKDVKGQVFQEINKLEKQSLSDKNIPELPKTDSKENNDMCSASLLAKNNTNPNETKINHNLQKGGKDVKEQVFQEIDKLVKTLYYSKTVPYEVALEYLKNINKEVENLKKKYQKNESQNMPEKSVEYVKPISKFKENLGGAVEEDYFRNNTLTDSDSWSSIDSDVPILPLNFNASIEKNTARNVEVDTKGYTIEYIQVEEPNKGVEKKTVELDKIHLQNSIQLEEQDNLDTLLNKIVLLKNQVKDDVERDVLDEIEKLITSVNSDDIPPDETLLCLQEFNRELKKDKEFFTDVERGQRKERDYWGDEEVLPEWDDCYGYDHLD